MSDSESSALSSVPSDDEPQVKLTTKDGKLSFVPIVRVKDTSAAKEAAPPIRKREPSPPHEYVPADNFDIPFLVMFRSRFSDCFPKSLSHYGPQDIERGIQETPPGEQVENLLCALLGLVLNRKKNPERGHFHRAVEEALSTQKPQWPFSWNGVSPLAGAKTFAMLTPTERLGLLKALAMWSLTSSEAVQAKIKESYKQSRKDDDLNQPLSVQPWGREGGKSGPTARYWLIEGLDDTSFRVYRDTAPYRVRSDFWTVAGTIDELKTLSQTLRGKETFMASRLSDNINKAIPRFEATDEKRKRREYRVMRKQQFARPEPGFSLYEGRTRGKRMKYTFSDEEDDDSDIVSNQRSTRNSGVSTPRDIPDGPTFTASGRQVKSRVVGSYGETILKSRLGEEVASTEGDIIETNGANGRSRRSGARQEENGWTKGVDHIETYNSVDEMDDEEEAASSGADDYAGDFEDEKDGAAESVGNDDDMSDADSLQDDQDEDKSLVVQLKVAAKGKRTSSHKSEETNSDVTSGKENYEDESVADNRSKTNGIDTTVNGKYQLKENHPHTIDIAVGQED